MRPPQGGLSYYGGKHPATTRCQWIVSIIGPGTNNHSYVEPFAGMLGVMLARGPARHEIVNDLNGYVLAWWTAVRDRPEEMKRRIALTPHSRVLFEQACSQAKRQCTGVLLSDAMTAHVCISQGLRKAMNTSPGQWRSVYASATGSLGKWTGDEIAPLAHRMRNVQLESREGCEILEACEARSDLVIYVDPPYRSADTRPYGDIEPDWERLMRTLARQSGHVAVSGYGPEWNALGWVCHELRDQHRPIGKNAQRGGQSTPRTERLWTNFTPQGSTMDLFAYDQGWESNE